MQHWSPAGKFTIDAEKALLMNLIIPLTSRELSNPRDDNALSQGFM